MINTGHKRIRRERPDSGNISDPGEIRACIRAVYQMINADAGRSRLDELVVHEIGDRSPQLLQCGRTKTVRAPRRCATGASVAARAVRASSSGDRE